MTSFADRARMTAAPTRARAKRVRPSSPHVPRPPWAPVRLRADGAASLAVEAAPNRTGLPNGLKEGMEALSGLSMDDVRVHRNSSEPARLGALAFARGSDIHLGSGQEHHLPHEAWHVIQQKQGRVSPTAQALPGLAVNDDPALEREADLMGAHSLMRAPEPGPSKASPRAAPVQAGSTAQARVVQCWLDPALLAGRTRDNRTRALAQQALAYNSDRKGKTRAVRIDQLQELLATTLKWLDDSPSPDQNTSPAARWAKDLLNAVQDEHQGLVRLSIADQDALPPVANFAQLPRTEQDFVRRTWQELVQGTGNIRITETENYAVGGGGSRQHQGFRIEVLAQFARLLGTATGRDIVAQVNADTGGAKLV
ncbi:MAG TPA: DUF4157 domain-containing protein, partial [Allosphingosinicella sp.]|nr:DUF4157 domain-containing protein [Allosphingosinicella sp.]